MTGIVVVVLAVMLLCALVGSAIKGVDGALLGLFFGPIGLIVAIILNGGLEPTSPTAGSYMRTWLSVWVRRPRSRRI